MQITIARTAFADAFTWAAKGISRHSVAPIVHGMRLSVEGETLTLATFDYKRAQRTRVQGTDAQPGVILVDGPGLHCIVKALPKARGTMVTFTSDGATLTLESSGITWTLQSLPMEEFPELPGMPAPAGIIDGAVFARAAARVAAAAGTDDTLPALTGVLFQPGEAALVMAATDRYRLTEDTVTWASAGIQGGPVNVPAKPLTEFAAKAPKHGKVHVYLDAGAGTFASPTRAGFRDDTRELIITGISGEFPRYRSLLRDESAVDITIGAGALAAAVKQVTPMLERNVPVHLNVTRESIIVEALRDGESAARVTVPCTSDQGGFYMGFNPEYLGSLLTGFDGSVDLGLTGNKPLTISAADCDFRAMVCQIRGEGGGAPMEKAATPAEAHAPEIEAGTPEHAATDVAAPTEAGTPAHAAHAPVAVPADVAPAVPARRLRVTSAPVAGSAYGDDMSARLAAYARGVKGLYAYAA